MPGFFLHYMLPYAWGFMLFVMRTTTGDVIFHQKLSLSRQMKNLIMILALFFRYSQRFLRV
jgi:hypothetical protein